MPGQPYRCEASSLEGFVKQLAVTYVGRSRCFFYVCGRVSPRLWPAEHDRRIIAKYDLNISRFTRSRRKRAGIAPLHYIRYLNFWVILCGQGKHAFFDANRSIDPATGEHVLQLRDVRQVPLKVWFDWRQERLAYAIGHSNGKAKIQIERTSYAALKSHFVDMATKRSLDQLIDAFWQVPFEPYGRVINQLFSIKRAVDRARQVAGLPGPLPNDAIPIRRKLVRVFESHSARPYQITVLPGNAHTMHEKREGEESSFQEDLPQVA